MIEPLDSLTIRVALKYRRKKAGGLCCSLETVSSAYYRMVMDRVLSNIEKGLKVCPNLHDTPVLVRRG